MDLPEKDVATGAQIILDAMTDTLADNNRIEVRGFGSFNLHLHPPRNAHNPRTGEKVITQAKYSPPLQTWQRSPRSGGRRQRKTYSRRRVNHDKNFNYRLQGPYWHWPKGCAGSI